MLSIVPVGYLVGQLFILLRQSNILAFYSLKFFYSHLKLMLFVLQLDFEILALLSECSNFFTLFLSGLSVDVLTAVERASALTLARR